MPSDSGCNSSTAPLPMLVVATGSAAVSCSAASASARVGEMDAAARHDKRSLGGSPAARPLGNSGGIGDLRSSG